MKKNIILILCILPWLFFLFGAAMLSTTSLVVDYSGNIIAPSTFLSANSNGINSVLHTNLQNLKVNVSIDENGNATFPINLIVGGTLYSPDFYATNLHVANIFETPVESSGTSFDPDISDGRTHIFTLTGNSTINAPINVSTSMVNNKIYFIFVQDSSGERTISLATNYLFGTELTELNYSTNAGSRSYATFSVVRTNVFDLIESVSGYPQ